MEERKHDLELYDQTKKREIGVPRLMWIRLRRIANRDNDPKSTARQLNPGDTGFVLLAVVL
jgi:hypothetical protein